jgi:hypothetical protein
VRNSLSLPDNICALTLRIVTRGKVSIDDVEARRNGGDGAEIINEGKFSSVTITNSSFIGNGFSKPTKDPAYYGLEINS